MQIRILMFFPKKFWYRLHPQSAYSLLPSFALLDFCFFGSGVIYVDGDLGAGDFGNFPLSSCCNRMILRAVVCTVTLLNNYT